MKKNTMQARLGAALVAMMAVGVLGVASPQAASANSGWRQRQLSNGLLEFRTLTPSGNAGGNRISAADIRYTKTGGGCITARFYHSIRDRGGAVIAKWADGGAFQACAGSGPKSYLWKHVSPGAYVPTGGSVVGEMVVSGQGSFTISISQSQL